MSNWHLFYELISTTSSIEDLKLSATKNFGDFGVYPNSIHAVNNQYFFLANVDGNKMLIVVGSADAFPALCGDKQQLAHGFALICELSIKNCKVMKEIFPFMNPSNHRGIDITIGLGDRLGLASPAHINLFKGLDAFPVLAQQSIRELTLTGRTYDDVLAAASWAVFQEDFTTGFGADGDHLKTREEIQMAIDCGFTMITLDCSEHIDNDAAVLDQAEINKSYDALPENIRTQLEQKYLSSELSLKDGFKLTFDVDAFKKTVLVYQKAIHYTIEVYNDVIKPCPRPIDFEMSIDETLTTTSPESHFFVAAELIDKGVVITSLAPRFCGEFQKGVDYRGDIAQFSVEFDTHVKIAKFFGYKVSVHSGSDKFSIFPIVGDKTSGKYHLKTAGTNWLEAVRVIAKKDPTLYRKMHKFAIQNLAEAKKYYHISGEASNVVDIDTLADSALPEFMNQDDSRQILHITYGLILQAKSADGAYLFKDEIMGALSKYEAEFSDGLQKHIGRHTSLLGIDKK